MQRNHVGRFQHLVERRVERAKSLDVLVGTKKRMHTERLAEPGDALT